MLVLTRKTQESVIVGSVDGFEPVLKITVLQINGGKVRLGFEVNASIPIHRCEIWEQICTGVKVEKQPERPPVKSMDNAMK